MRFTACDDAVRIRKTQTRKTTPSAIVVGRMNERFVEMPVSSDERATIRPNSTETIAVPRELLDLREPEGTTVPDLHEVVEEADDAEPHGREDQRDARRRVAGSLVNLVARYASRSRSR